MTIGVASVTFLELGKKYLIDTLKVAFVKMVKSFFERILTKAWFTASLLQICVQDGKVKEMVTL